MTPDAVYTISARGKSYREPVEHFLRTNFADIPLSQIDSLFGFVEPCTLYGGRPYQEPQFSNNDILKMYAHNIGLRIPLTNHYVTETEYEGYGWLLEKYHVAGNSVIITNDTLASWLRRDFPLYNIESSVIQEITTYAKIEAAYTLYDTVVLPMRISTDLAFLEGIDDKSRITLFANAGCALNCPARICYQSVSKLNKFRGELFEGTTFACSKKDKEREVLGMVDFDLEPLAALGFRRFKLLRGKPKGMTAF